MFYTLAAYVMWGIFPAYFPLLLPAGAGEILAHRIIWTAVLVTAYLALTGKWRELVRLSRRTWAGLVVASVAITINWGSYIIAINTGHVADAALGYFINPLFSIALGVAFLSEKLRRPQTIAVAIAFVGVVWLTFATGQPPVYALLLALSFGLYGLIKKRLPVTSTGSVAAETLLAAPFALGYLATLDDPTFTSEGTGHMLLLIASGVVTAAPLLCFAQGAKSLPLATLGMLQYLTPTMQLLWALVVKHEPMPPERWVGFAIIWLAVAIYLTDLVRKNPRRSLRARRQPS